MGAVRAAIRGPFDARPNVVGVSESRGWQPASGPEAMLYHALLRSDTARFFRIVAESPLFVPAVSAPSRRLVTWTREERVFVLAFSSPAGLARVVGAEADSVLELSYEALARDWPDPTWWLALNPSTPIDAALPVSAVAEAARGEVPLELPAMPLGANAPSIDLGAGSAERAAGSAGGRAGAAADGGAGPGALGGSVPANELEEAMAEALAQGNIALLLDLLVFADVLLPTLRPASPGTLDDPCFPWAALPLTPEQPVDELAVGVFTSPSRLAEASPGVDVPTVRVPLMSVVEAWPGSEYTLLVNPGSSLRARLPGSEVPALVEWARVAALYHGVGPTPI